MRRLSLILATALVATTASPPPAMADKKTDAVIAGAIIGALIAGAANKNREKHRYNYATDTTFYPADLPGAPVLFQRPLFSLGNKGCVPMKSIMLRALSPLMFAALPVVALAEDVPLSVTMDGSVALQASILAEGTLNEVQVQVLKDVAHQKAVVLTCEGFAIDDARFAGVFETAYPTDVEFEALDEAGQVQLRSVMMLVLGTFLGGNVAIASTDTAAWCASAAEEKAQADAPNRIWAD